MRQDKGEKVQRQAGVLITLEALVLHLEKPVGKPN
jgi:hypothetical protein